MSTVTTIAEATASPDQSPHGPQTLEQARLLRPATADRFVEGRARFLAEYLELQFPLHGLRVVDFACGVGNDSGELREQLHAEHVIGFDADRAALEVAQQRYCGSRFHSWTADANDIAPASVDVVVAVGMLLTRTPDERQQTLQLIYSWLRPGGYLALFENNPRCAWGASILPESPRKPVDKKVWPSEVAKRVVAAGFEGPLVRSLFFFPRTLGCLQRFETLLAPIPMGAQYVSLSKRPD